MEAIELQKMYLLEDSYWWFVARRRLVERLFRKFAPQRNQLTILDVGCGTGATLQLLRKFGRAIGLDLAAPALALSATRGKSPLVQGSATKLPFLDQTVEVATALDLLEHLEDDQTALDEIRRVLRPGGIAILTLPAHQFLWSEHDEALRHRRRYSAPQVRRLLRRAGLRIISLSYVITLLFFPIFAFRFWQQVFNPVGKAEAKTALRPLPGFLNRILVRILDQEASLLLRFGLPLGVSIACVAQKPPN